MVPHKYRGLALVIFALAEIALVLMAGFDVVSADTVVKVGATLGALAIALGLGDWGNVEKRRRDPDVPALRDDILDHETPTNPPRPRRPSTTIPPPPGSTLALVMTIAASTLLASGIVAISIGVAGCSGAAQQHRSLNTLTSIADPTYGEAVDLCDRLRNRVVERAGTTYEEDRADMDAIHEVCDAMVAGFESLRSSQLTARAAIASGVDGAIRDAIREGLRLWPIAQQLVDRIEERAQR